LYVKTQFNLTKVKAFFDDAGPCVGATLVVARLRLTQWTMGTRRRSRHDAFY